MHITTKNTESENKKEFLKRVKSLSNDQKRQLFKEMLRVYSQEIRLPKDSA